jgi:hypothetical protein
MIRKRLKFGSLEILAFKGVLKEFLCPVKSIKQTYNMKREQ